MTIKLKPYQRERIARNIIGYNGPMSGFNQFLESDQAKKTVYNNAIAQIDQKMAVKMQSGGAVDKSIYKGSGITYSTATGMPVDPSKEGSTALTAQEFKNVYGDKPEAMKVFSKIYGLDSIGLRYFNIFGKRQDPQGSYAAVIPKWISSILNNEQVFINGNGDTSRDFCYINNVIEINILAALSKNKESKNQIYNVALNDNINLNELFNLISAKILSRLPTTQIKKPIHKDYREGDVLHSQADISKAKKLLDYDPIYDINKGLEDCMDWFVNDLK